MKVLSIDTSSNICSVAILENATLIKEINLDNGLTHSESLMPAIDAILKTTGLSLQQIELIVCDKGPGSFTGIRIGTATVMAFADSQNIPACGISSLEALANNVEGDGVICSLIDARNQNCYCGIYEHKNGHYRPLERLLADHIDSILVNLRKYTSTITFVGNGAVLHKEKIKSEIPNYSFVDNNNLSAYKLGIAGLNAYLSDNFENVMPLYLRKSQAERMMEEKNNENK